MKIILATHGTFSEGILNSAKLILGEELCEDIFTLSAYTKDDYDLHLEAIKKLNELEGEPLIVITDVFGGSVNNEFFALQKEFNFELITGLNLPLLLEVISNREQLNIDLIVETSKHSIKHCALILDEFEGDDF